MRLRQTKGLRFEEAATKSGAADGLIQLAQLLGRQAAREWLAVAACENGIEAAKTVEAGAEQPIDGGH